MSVLLAVSLLGQLLVASAMAAVPAVHHSANIGLKEVLPTVRPFLGASLVGGARSLIDLTELEEGGHPNRIVRHVPFADVNRDGTDDVLELDAEFREGHPTYGFIGVLRITTLNGRSGRVIGRYVADFDSGGLGAVLARVGPRAEPGVIFFVNRFLTTPSNPTATLDVKAVTGSGEEVWARRWVSTSTSTASRYVAATNVAVPTDILERRGDTTDLLVATYDYAGAVLSLTPTVVSGKDGSSIEHERITVPWLEATPVPVSAPDLDGDGRHDVLVVDTSGLGEGLKANSSSGAELWHQPDTPSGGGYMTADLGNVVGDRTRDFVLGDPVRLIDGATGEGAWERPGGSYVLSYGDVDGDGKRDVFASDAFADENRFGANIKVLSSRGRLLAERPYVAPRPAPGFSWIIQDDAGDINGDGIEDAALHLLHYGDEVTIERRFIVGSATAKPLHRGSALFALGGSLTGDTDDLLHVRRKGNTAILKARRGRDGRQIWDNRVRENPRRPLAYRPTAAGGGKTRRNVLVTFFDRTSARALLLDGRTGRIVWTRVLRPSDD